MWGFGGRFYWGRKERCDRTEGIVVAFAWMSSEEKHLRSYVRLYGELGWDSLVCHSQFLNMFFPDKATGLAVNVVRELVQELKLRPCPVVFASFSGGPKACMYKILQIIDDETNSLLKMDDRQLVRDCIAGFIYDSSPVDFTSDLGTKFVLHPSVIKMSQPPKIASWIAHGISSSLDALFLTRFESHRAEYWQTLYATVSMKVPYLLLCSETDDLAPYQTISNFAQRLQDLGGDDVKLISWKDSPHVGHYRLHPEDYKNAVVELLTNAAMVYSQRIQRLEAEKISSDGSSHGKMSESLFNLRRSAMDSTTSFQNITLSSSNQLHLPNSMEYYIGGGASVHDGQKEGLIHLPSTPSINANGILGQILFDVCIPKDIEGWDMRPTSSLSARRHSAFNPIKCIRRSRL
ncbi:unnamed protein product [Rhodiola kirilowii]